MEKKGWWIIHSIIHHPIFNFFLAIFNSSPVPALSFLDFFSPTFPYPKIPVRFHHFFSLYILLVTLFEFSQKGKRERSGYGSSEDLITSLSLSHFFSCVPFQRYVCILLASYVCCWLWWLCSWTGLVCWAYVFASCVVICSCLVWIHLKEYWELRWYICRLMKLMGCVKLISLACSAVKETFILRYYLFFDFCRCNLI